MTNSESSDSSETDSTLEQQVATEQFAFHGSGSDYFRIWIVNLLFSILTLGIYSAWAKVRTKRYFYGNTELAGDRFEYLASPIAILKGRLIGVALLAVYTFTGFLSPQISGAAAIVLGLLLPLIFVQALRFNAHNSAWRGIRFGFDGSFALAYMVYLVRPIGGLLTLGLALPWVFYKINQFQIDNHRFGATPVLATARPGGFYRITLISLGIFLVFFILFSVASAIVVITTISFEFVDSLSTELENPEDIFALPDFSTFLLVFILIYFALLLLIFVARLVYEALRFRLVFNNIEIADNKLRNSLSAAGYYWILLSNLLLTIVSLGFFTPWARVRRARYLLSRMWLNTTDLESFAASEANRVSAQGDEVGEAFDLGIGI